MHINNIDKIIKQHPASPEGKKEGRNTNMLDKVIENNRVTIIGEVVSEFEYSHEVYGEGFYTLNISVNRLSNSVDIIPLMVSERLVDVTEDLRGVIIEASGQFRSYNRHEETRNRLVLSIFVRELQFLDDYMEENSTNQIFLDGYICKPSIYRKTPLGREIADILIAVNRPYGKSDYIPCIAWGRNARFAAGFEVGTHIQIYGRIQSREYTKKINEEECERRTAYEVSVSKIECFDE
jgi:single-stranded DNA-binding protein